MLIKYKNGYKYQLVEDYSIEVNVYPAREIDRSFIHLSMTGMLTIQKGYAWDGPSGPTVDTANFMRGSLVHDALYQLLRNDDIPQRYRKVADRELQRICIEDGMSKLRAWWVYNGVKIGGQHAASQAAIKKVLQAP